jgi:beta-ureidopropionase / N-carbamoyl-L-amino-acid hydrolase
MSVPYPPVLLSGMKRQVLLPAIKKVVSCWYTIAIFYNYFFGGEPPGKKKITMRKLLFGLVLFFSFAASGQPNVTTLKVNEQRIEQRIFELAKFGKDSSGKSYRVAYSKADIEGRGYVMGLMKQAGLTVTIDYAGNITGKRKGKDAAKKPIAFGSHIDMVPAGGNYDGCVGSLSAIEVIEVLNQNKIVTTHPLEVIIFCDEEGGTTGSRALAGQLNKAALGEISNSGLTIGEGIKAIGGNPDKINEVKMAQGDLSAFVELHIEQGGILEKEKIQIGVVEGIVGIEHWEVTVEGFANHAGTTPMNNRQDALLAAAKFIIAVNEVVNSYDGRQVGTVGKIAVAPGAPNVIPGKCVMTLELRDLSYEKIMKLYEDIQHKAADIAKASSTTISFKRLNTSATAALTAKKIQDKIVASASQLGMSYKFMQSGAGHDSQEMAFITPVGMIFIPSVGGISHSPKEFSTPADMANGANVLLQTIMKLDQE